MGRVQIQWEAQSVEYSLEDMEQGGFRDIGTVKSEMSTRIDFLDRKEEVNGLNEEEKR